MRIEFAKGFCFHPQASPNTCSERIIRAHTVQRKGGLAAIAEDGHVISTMTAFEDIFKNEGKLVPRELGVRSASTFMGFCNRHDTEMFHPVETGSVLLTSENAFLLSFRALAYEYLTKQAALQILKIERDMDRGKSFKTQCEIQNYIHLKGAGLLRGLADLQRWKAGYDTAFKEQRFDAYRFYGVAFSDVLPVVGCGGFHPEFDFNARPLQKISRGTAPHEHVTYNLTVLNGKSVVALGWTEGDSGPSAAFAGSFAVLPASEKAEAAVRLAFEHLENVYMKPSWWHGLPKVAQDAAITRMISGTGMNGAQRGAGCLKPDGHSYTVGVEVAEEFAS